MNPEEDDTEAPGGTGTAFSCTCGTLYSSASDVIACSQRHG